MKFAEKQIDGLIFSKEKPLRDDEGYEEWMDCGDSIELPKHWFPEVTWEDEPQKVKLSIEKE